MKAAILEGLNVIRVKDVSVPKVKCGSLLIKVRICAVCGSDVRIFEYGNSRVKYPAIMGHEIAGDVIAVGEGVTAFKVGDRVAVGADIPCGRCMWCLNGMGNCCNENYAMGYQFSGGFAEYCLLEPMVVQYGPVCKIPEILSYEEAALAEPLACCINGLERVFFKSGKSVLIVGAGPIGILLAKLSQAFGASCVILSDIDKERLFNAAIANADYTMLFHSMDLHDEIMSLTQGKGMDVIFIACPSPDAQEQVINMIAKRGFINWFGGLPQGTRNISISSNGIHYKEAYITGSHGSTPLQHRHAVQLIATKKIVVSDLISHVYNLDAIEQALLTVKNREGLKVLIKF